MSLLDELKATEKEWQRQGDYSHSDTLLEAIEEIERLRAAFAELLECHDVSGYVQLDKDFHERMSSVLGPEASSD